MRGFDTPGLQLSGFSEQQSESAAQLWKRFATATLLATAALLLCAVIVVILAPLLPHPAYVSHAASVSLLPPASHARI